MSLQGMQKLVAAVAFCVTALAYAGAPRYDAPTLSDSDDGEAKESFTPDIAKIYLHAGLVDVASGSKLGSTWIAEDTGGAAPPNYKIDSVELTAGALINVATFSLSNPTAGWPVGAYRVDLSIDGKAAGTAHFKIEAE
jgi:hypothetical protein